MFAFVQFFKGTTTNSVKVRIDKLHRERHNIRESISLAVADRTAAINKLQSDLDEFLSLDRQF